ncbi:MAG: TatD family hydrolase [Bacteroidales bacterium]|jgi:TatD DNase family protein|nr:TatD family hydrolase [Bacteroidales bacterium]
MKLPEAGDYIDIHTHGATVLPGIFSVETLMAHEEKLPGNYPGIIYSFGIHPWFLEENNHDRLLSRVVDMVDNPLIVAIGEAGFDKIKGPSSELQRKTFEEQVNIAEKHRKPVVIHCVRAWEELLQEHKKLSPDMPWLVHGFRGKPELAMQLISRGMYLSFWFDYVLRPESSKLIRSLPADRIFLETDGSGVDIRDIYNKVSNDLGFELEIFKGQILRNFNIFFNNGR